MKLRNQTYQTSKTITNKKTFVKIVQKRDPNLETVWHKKRVLATALESLFHFVADTTCFVEYSGRENLGRQTKVRSSNTQSFLELFLRFH